MRLRFLSQTPRSLEIFLAVSAITLASCAEKPPADRARVSGEVETTEVHVASPVAGRVLELPVIEGGRVPVGALIARLDTADAELALARARADRDQATAQLRLVQAGARPEDIRQAEAQVAAAESDVSAAAADLTAAEVDVERFEALVASNSGSRKQRDDAVARGNVARERLQGAKERVRAAQEAVVRLRAGARREEVDVARTRVAAAVSQMAVWEKAIADATVTAPVAGVITQSLVDAGEIVQPRAPLVVIADLDHAWANVYVAEPDVPRLRLGQGATLFTDAGGEGIAGTVSYISDKAEFTPRNVQTAEDRSKLVYRVKVAVDNTDGALKAGMPVEAEIPFVR
jgi:HlyD family secretion protein